VHPRLLSNFSEPPRPQNPLRADESQCRASAHEMTLGTAAQVNPRHTGTDAPKNIFDNGSNTIGGSQKLDNMNYGRNDHLFHNPLLRRGNYRDLQSSRRYSANHCKFYSYSNQGVSYRHRRRNPDGGGPQVEPPRPPRCDHDPHCVPTRPAGFRGVRLCARSPSRVVTTNKVLVAAFFSPTTAGHCLI